MLRFDNVPRDDDDDRDDAGLEINRALAPFWIAPSTVHRNGTIRIGLGTGNCCRSVYPWVYESSDGSSCIFCLRRQYVYSFNGLVILGLVHTAHTNVGQGCANTSLMFQDYISNSSCEELSENMAPPLEGVSLLR